MGVKHQASFLILNRFHLQFLDQTAFLRRGGHSMISFWEVACRLKPLVQQITKID